VRPANCYRGRLITDRTRASTRISETRIADRTSRWRRQCTSLPGAGATRAAVPVSRLQWPAVAPGDRECGRGGGTRDRVRRV